MIELTWPWLLLLIPLPLLVRYFIPPATNQAAFGLKVPFYNQLRTMEKQTKRLSQLSFRWQHIIAYVIWLLLVIGASGPLLLGPIIDMPRSGRNLLLAIDLSGSMSLPDFTLGGRNTNRLDVIKKVAGEFIDGRQGDRLGLIFFGSKAYLRTPLTYDITTVKRALMDADIGLAGQMTAIGDAIGLAVKRLQQYPEDSRVLILLTDGASNSGELLPMQAAEVAAHENIRIHTIAIGSDRYISPGVRINDLDDIDEETLMDISALTGGEFFRAKDTAALAKIYDRLDELEPIETESEQFRLTKPLYPWCLGLAILLLMFLMGRKYGFWKHLRKNTCSYVKR